MKNAVASKKYGYARCSTSEKKQDVEYQVRLLKEAGVLDENIFVEYASGTKDASKRTKWKKVLKSLQPRDTLITTEVSRMCRSTKQLCDMIEMAKEKNLCLNIGNFIVDCRNSSEIEPMTEGMLKMMGVFSEMESSMIRSRVLNGLHNARAKGVQLGRRKTTIKDIPHSFFRYYPQYKAGNLNVTEFSRLCELTRKSIYKYIKIAESK